MEQQAIQAVFREHATAQPESELGLVAVSSTKGSTGHLLGAAGAIESIFTIKALKLAMAPPTINLAVVDPHVLSNIVANSPQKLRSGPSMAISNSFGFGGTNASLVFSTFGK